MAGVLTKFTVRSHIGPQLWRCAMKIFCQKINGEVLELEVATESSIYDVKVSAMPMDPQNRSWSLLDHPFRGHMTKNLLSDRSLDVIRGISENMAPQCPSNHILIGDIPYHMPFKNQPFR